MTAGAYTAHINDTSMLQWLENESEEICNERQEQTPKF